MDASEVVANDVQVEQQVEQVEQQVEQYNSTLTRSASATATCGSGTRTRAIRVVSPGSRIASRCRGVNRQCPRASIHNKRKCMTRPEYNCTRR